MGSVLQEAAALSAAGQPFVLATVVWRRAPTSGTPGSKAIVLPGGEIRGWIGGACAQPTIVREALAALAADAPRLVFLGPADEFDGTLRDGVTRVPMACESEGALEIYLEPIVPAPHVLVVGDSELVHALAAMAQAIGWTASVVDDPASVTADARTAVVVATQGRYDEAAVRAALTTSAGYVGLVASRKRAAGLLAFLRADGLADEVVAGVRAPAGLDLGPVRHDEIAVAVLAELVALRASGGLRGAVVPEARAAEAIDPVCGMTVAVAGARHVVVWRGRTVYFCAESCRRAFEADPEKYPATTPA